MIYKVPKRTTGLICPFCHSNLLERTYRNEFYFCDCHKQEGLEGEGERFFSWRWDFDKSMWFYLKVKDNKVIWVEAIFIHPEVKKVFIFR